MALAALVGGVVAGGDVVVGGLGILAMATNALIVWVLFSLSALAFGAFCALWAYARSIQLERSAKVRSMRRQPAPDWAPSAGSSRLLYSQGLSWGPKSDCSSGSDFTSAAACSTTT